MTNRSKRKPKVAGANVEKGNGKFTVVVGDFHVPYHDVPLFDAFIVWLIEERKHIDGVVINGDLCDMYPISRFAKDPARRFTLGRDIKASIGVLGEIRCAIGTGKDMAWLGGNHEDRLRKFKWDKVPEFHDLDCLSIESLFELEALKIEYREAFTEVDVHGFNVMHGDLVRQHSAYSAKALVDRWAANVVMNHTHRMGCHMHMFPGKRIIKGYENGCMCRLDPEYIVGTPNWHPGWGVIPSSGSSVEWVMTEHDRAERWLLWRGQRWAL